MDHTTATTTPPAEAPGAAGAGPEADPCTTPAEAPGAAGAGPAEAPGTDPGTAPTTAPAEPFHRPAQLPPFGPGARLVFNDEQRRRAQVIDSALTFVRRDISCEVRVLLHLACFGPARIVSIAKALGLDRTTVFRRCRMISRGRYSRGRVLPPHRAGLIEFSHDNHGQPGSTTTLRLTDAGADIARALVGE